MATQQFLLSLSISPCRPRVRKSRYWGEMLLSPIHCYDVTKPPYLLSGELCTSPLHSNRLYVYTVCCRRGSQCFSVLRTRHTDVVGDSNGRSYATERGHNVPLLRTRAVDSVQPCFNWWLHCTDSSQNRARKRYCHVFSLNVTRKQMYRKHLGWKRIVSNPSRFLQTCQKTNRGVHNRITLM